MFKYFFLAFSFVSSFGDAVFLTGIPLYLYTQSGSLTASALLPVVIAVTILLFRHPIAGASEVNPVLLTGLGELTMVGLELVILFFIPFTNHTLLLSVATIPLAVAYNIYGSAKFFRVQEYFFEQNMVFWTALQGIGNKVGFIAGGGASALILAKSGLAGLIVIDLASFLAFGLFMLFLYLFGHRTKIYKQESSSSPTSEKTPILPRNLSGLGGIGAMSAITLLLVWERSSLIPSATLALGTTSEFTAELRTIIVVGAMLLATVLLRLNAARLSQYFFAGLIFLAVGVLMTLIRETQTAGFAILLLGIGCIMATQLPLQKLIYNSFEIDEKHKSRLIANHWIWTSALTLLLLPINYFFSDLGHMTLVCMLGSILFIGGLGGIAVAEYLIGQRSKSLFIGLVTIGSLGCIVFASSLLKPNERQPIRTALLGTSPKHLDPIELTEVNYSTLFNQVCGRLTVD